MASEFERAVADPAAAFTAPEDVLRRSDFSDQQQRAILRRWLEDAQELSTAEEEGMAGGEPSLIERVSAALARLESR